MLRFREILGMALRGEVRSSNTLELAREIIRLRKEKFIDQPGGIYAREQKPMYDNTTNKTYNVIYYIEPNGSKTIVYITPDNSELREIVEYFHFYRDRGYNNLLVGAVKTPEAALTDAIAFLAKY